jgi:hypothetical protein
MIAGLIMLFLSSILAFHLYLNSVSSGSTIIPTDGSVVGEPCTIKYTSNMWYPNADSLPIEEKTYYGTCTTGLLCPATYVDTFSPNYFDSKYAEHVPTPTPDARCITVETCNSLTKPSSPGHPTYVWLPYGGMCVRALSPSYSISSEVLMN